MRLGYSGEDPGGLFILPLPIRDQCTNSTPAAFIFGGRVLFFLQSTVTRSFINQSTELILMELIQRIYQSSLFLNSLQCLTLVIIEFLFSYLHNKFFSFSFAVFPSPIPLMFCPYILTLLFTLGIPTNSMTSPITHMQYTLRPTQTHGLV